MEWEKLTAEPLDPHHVFHRSHLPSIPAVYCDSAEMVIAICHDWPATGHHGCHQRIHDDGDAALIGAARGKALTLFAAKHGLEAELTERLEWEPLALMRELCRLLEARETPEEGIA